MDGTWNGATIGGTAVAGIAMAPAIPFHTSGGIKPATTTIAATPQRGAAWEPAPRERFGREASGSAPDRRARISMRKTTPTTSRLVTLTYVARACRTSPTRRVRSAA